MSVPLSTIGPVMLIGAGQMGLALARGWLEAGLPPSNLVLVDPLPGDAARAFAEDFELTINTDPVGLQPSIMVLAVKPQIIDHVMPTLRPALGHHTIALSVAAGIDLARLAAGLGTDRVVRTMPNTPAQLGKGVTGAVAGKGVDAAGREACEALMRAAGDVFWFDAETAIDSVTAISGSGPAYVFHLVEALASAGESQGLDPLIAMRLARQTVIGAAALLEADPASARILRENVTSPNGTTAAALEVLMAELPDLMARTTGAARRRSEELGKT